MTLLSGIIAQSNDRSKDMNPINGTIHHVYRMIQRSTISLGRVLYINVSQSHL